MSKSLFSLSLCAVAMAAGLSACSRSEEEKKPVPEVVATPAERVLIEKEIKAWIVKSHKFTDQALAEKKKESLDGNGRIFNEDGIVTIYATAAKPVYSRLEGNRSLSNEIDGVFNEIKHPHFPDDSVEVTPETIRNAFFERRNDFDTHSESVRLDTAHYSTVDFRTGRVCNFLPEQERDCQNIRSVDPTTRLAKDIGIARRALNLH